VAQKANKALEAAIVEQSVSGFTMEQRYQVQLAKQQTRGLASTLSLRLSCLLRFAIVCLLPD